MLFRSRGVARLPLAWDTSAVAAPSLRRAVDARLGEAAARDRRSGWDAFLLVFALGLRADDNGTSSSSSSVSGWPLARGVPGARRGWEVDARLVVSPEEDAEGSGISE